MVLGILIFYSQFSCRVDTAEILKIRVSPRHGEDVLAWGPGRLGVFSVKSAYQMAFDEASRETAAASSSSPDGSRSCWQLVWGSMVTPNIKNLAWRVAVNSLPTWQNKNKRGLEVSGICPVCGTEMDYCFHALYRCPLAVQLWDCMCEVWSLPKIRNVANTGVEWLLDVLHPLGEVERAMVLFTFWRC